MSYEYTLWWCQLMANSIIPGWGHASLSYPQVFNTLFEILVNGYSHSLRSFSTRNDPIALKLWHLQPFHFFHCFFFLFSFYDEWGYAQLLFHYIQTLLAWHHYNQIFYDTNLCFVSLNCGYAALYGHIMHRFISAYPI